MSLKKIIKKIKENNSFLIAAHLNPEADALGSQLALRALLLRLGKKVQIVNEDSVPAEYRFLPAVRSVKKLKAQKIIGFDAFIVLDCSDLGRCRKVSNAAAQAKVIINIDHHLSNDYFGDINWVDCNASSASEMIYELYKKMKVPLNRNIALCLYAGIMTDTGSFRYPNTTVRSLRIAADLLRYGLKPDKIYNKIYQNLSLSEARIIRLIIDTMNTDATGKIVWFKVKKSLCGSLPLSYTLVEHILDFGRMIKDADAVVLFKENSNKGAIRVNLRSKKTDVNKIAAAFGGGGHKNASGATITGSLNNVESKVIRKIKQQLATTQ